MTELRAWTDTGRPVIDATGAEVGVSLCCGDAAPGFVRFEGFEVLGAAAHGILVRGPGASDIVLLDNIVRNNGAGPSMAGEGSGITVDEGAANTTVEGNQVLDNASMSEGQVTRGIVVDAGESVRVLDNLVQGTSSNGIRIEGGSGVIVMGNTVRGGGTNGITFFGDAHQATFNVLCQNAAVGIRALDTSDLIIEHNSFVNQGSFGVELAGDSRGTFFRSNAVVNSGGPGVTSVTEDPTTSHNMFVANDGGYAGAATGDPTDRGDTDPLFVDRGNCDVTLMPGSPAIGAAHDGGNVGAR
jgi:hypothetical protein